MKQQDNEQSQPPVAQFSTGLRDCFKDVPLCCLTFWCPCITFGQIAEIVDKGSAPCGVSGTLYTLLLGFTGFQWIYSCMYRSKLKALYGIEDDCCEDCCTHFWCECCALCQEYRELQHRGYDVALGWQGNMKKKNQENDASLNARWHDPISPNRSFNVVFATWHDQ